MEYVTLNNGIIIFDGVSGGYYAFGERVGNAFKDGAQLK